MTFKSTDKSEYIYLIRRRDGSVKIGRSKNPDARLKTFRTADPSVELLAKYLTSNAQIDESQLHKAYANKRFEGEWFRLTTQDINNIQSKFNKSSNNLLTSPLLDNKAVSTEPVNARKESDIGSILFMCIGSFACVMVFCPIAYYTANPNEQIWDILGFLAIGLFVLSAYAFIKRLSS